MQRQVELTDPFTTNEHKLAWRDRRIDEHREYLRRLECAHEKTDGRKDQAGKWARAQIERDIESVRDALANVPGIEAEREAWRSAIAACDETQRAVEAATTPDQLIDARARAELAQRVATAAFEAFKAAAHASRLPGIESYPLNWGATRCFETLQSLNGHARALENYAPSVGKTFAESAAYDAARNSAAHCELAVVPWVIAGTDPNSQVARLWFSFVARRFSIDGGEAMSEIFPASAAE